MTSLADRLKRSMRLAGTAERPIGLTRWPTRFARLRAGAGTKEGRRTMTARLRTARVLCAMVFGRWAVWLAALTPGAQWHEDRG